MLGLTKTAGSGRVLSFDIENRPLSYWLPDRPTAEITAIASCWTDNPDASVKVHVLGMHSPEEILEGFLKRYNEADIVTGHYIRAHDLPIINGALMEYGMPILKPKLTSDTRIDLVAKADIPATQEYLLEMLGINHRPKYHMTQWKWRMANRLDPKGIAETVKRATSDVLGQTEMRAEMLRRGLISAPKLWSPER